jgi:hypothetical protein
MILLLIKFDRSAPLAHSFFSSIYGSFSRFDCYESSRMISSKAETYFLGIVESSTGASV